MRKLLLLSTCLFISLNVFASHIQGGDVSWYCDGNGKIIFHLNLYRECGSGTTSFGTTQIINGPQGNITVSRYNSEGIGPTCLGGQGLPCNLVLPGQGAVELVQYKSNPITLTGTPPPAGWDFVWNSCCRPAGVVNVSNPSSSAFYLRSTMFSLPGGCASSPAFNAQALQVINPSIGTLQANAFKGDPSDSLYFDFAPMLGNNSIPINFATGYSYDNPFPNSNQNSANIDAIINHQTGLISYRSDSATNGFYAYSVEVEQWRGYNLISVIHKSLMVIGQFNGFATNNSPTVNIDTTIYQGMITTDGKNFSTTVSPGDTVNFQMIAYDSDYNSGTNSFQQITFSARGSALDTIWMGSNNYNSIATLSPASPQSGFTSQLTNKVNFSWVIGQEHLSGTKSTHSFQFQFKDDMCGTTGLSHVSLVVTVKPVANIGPDTLQVCQGDSIALSGFTRSGNYQWSPATGLSSATTSNPLAAPAAAQYYYLSDPQNPAYEDSVYVQVQPKGTFNLTFSMGKLELTGTAQNTTNTWYYNGVPFAYPHDTLTPFGLGEYYVVGRSGACRYVSDTVSITMGMSFSVTSSGNGTYNNTSMPVPGSLGVTFQVNQNTNVSNVSIPGIADVYGKTGGYDLKLQLYDDTQTEIYNKDLTLQKPLDDLVRVPVNFTLDANKDYTAVVSGDTAYTFNLYENLVLPSTPHNVGLTVKSVAEGAHGQFPTSPTAYLLPISFGIGQTVSLEESLTDDWKIYPNPASDQFRVSGLSDAKSLDLVDVNGKVVQRYQLGTDQGEVEVKTDRLAQGLYFVKVHFENTTSVKKVLFQ